MKSVNSLGSKLGYRNMPKYKYFVFAMHQIISNIYVFLVQYSQNMVLLNGFFFHRLLESHLQHKLTVLVINRRVNRYKLNF
jgi:hypothetical protein